jgi:hypothetical protein
MEVHVLKSVVQLLRFSEQYINKIFQGATLQTLLIQALVGNTQPYLNDIKLQYDYSSNLSSHVGNASLCSDRKWYFS